MRIAIMGAGGIGGYVGGRLAQAGLDVAFIARGPHLAALRSVGLRIISPFGDAHIDPVSATDKPEEIGPVDVVVFAVKLFDSESAAAALAPLVSPSTRVVTLQNGIDSVDIVSRFVARAQVIGGVIYLIASMSAPGVITSGGGVNQVIIDDGGNDPVVAAFAAACRQAPGFTLQTTANIITVLWEKFISLRGFSGATALMRSTIGPILANPESRAFAEQLFAEGCTVARAAGIALSHDYAHRIMALWRTIPAESRSSMAHDLEQGRRLELDWLSGRMHNLGIYYGIPTPAHTATYRALKLHADGFR